MGGMSLPSYESGVSEVPLLGETIGQNLRRTVATYGDREALVEVATGRRWTYAEFGAAVDEFARGLMARGIAKGDRVGIWAPNCAEWTITQYATAAIGAILVNINPAYRTHELAYALNQSGVKLLISATEFKTSEYRKMVEEVRPDCTALEDVVYIGTPDWAAVVEAAASITPEQLDERAAELSFDDAINIQYTSGTTGFPKGATLSHHNILNNGYFVTETIAFGPDDRLCIPVPFYHCFGMVMANLGCTTHGSCMVIPAPAFDPATTLKAVQDERCTALYGVPTMFIAELGLPDFAVVRPQLFADRRDGGIAVPDRGDEALRRRHAHGRGGDLLRDDRDLAGVDADPARRRPGPPYVDRRPGDAACRGEARGPCHWSGGRAR